MPNPEYYQKNKEWIKESNRLRYSQRKEKYKQSQKIYRERPEVKEANKQRCRDWWAKHKTEKNQIRRTKEYKEYANKLKRDYYSKNRERVLLNNKKYSESPRGKLRHTIYQAEYRKRQYRIESMKRFRVEHPEVFLKSKIKSYSRFGFHFNMNSDQYNYALRDWSKTVRKSQPRCQICGSGENLMVHHILHKSKYPKLSLNITNGVTLCEKHHWEVHGRNLINFS